MEIPEDHPRAKSLKIREKIIEGMHKNIVAEAGLIAHGRGEAFDYLIGEKTPNIALRQEEAAVALLLTAKHPVISVNGNVAVLCNTEIVQFSNIIQAPLEVNLFYRRQERGKIVESELKKAGAKEVLGTDPDFFEIIPELSHLRRIVDKRGIYAADVVLVALEDGDRTMALRKIGKEVIAIDLNPLSRTALWGTITIVNNVIRAIPEMIELAKKMKDESKEKLRAIVKNFDNYESLRTTIAYINRRLFELAKGKLENYANHNAEVEK